jgi:hypothetical protein
MNNRSSGTFGDSGRGESAKDSSVLPPSYRRVTVVTLRWKVYWLAGKLVRHARGWTPQIKADLEKWVLLQSVRVCRAMLRN